MNTPADSHSMNQTDRILSEFFQAEIPTPWPAWNPPQLAEPRREPLPRLYRDASRFPKTTGRWTLVVSAVVLLGFGLMLTRGSHSEIAERTVPPHEAGHTLYHHATADGSQLQPPVDKTITKSP